MGRGRGVNRDIEFVWWCSKFIRLLGFPVRSKRGSENSGNLEGNCLSKERKRSVQSFLLHTVNEGHLAKWGMGAASEGCRALAAELEPPRALLCSIL